MKRVSTFLVALALCNQVVACCLSYADIAMTLTDESALIIWDEKSKTQHFIRRASFEGQAKDFGFILPVPSKPDAIEVANDEVFSFLAALTPRPASRGALGGATGGAASVEVLEQKMVGDFQASVIRSDSGSAISDWLSENGHKMRPAMTPWFDHYNSQKWMYVAFRYMGNVASTKTKAVRVTTKTPQPYYPYKMPTDTWEKGHYRPMDLFVISQTPVTANYSSGKAWEAEVVGSYNLDRSNTSKLVGYLAGEDPLSLQEGLTVTRFTNSPLANNYDEDITFRLGSLEKWPRAGGAMVSGAESANPTPQSNMLRIAGGTGVTVSLLVAAVAMRKRRRNARG